MTTKRAVEFHETVAKNETLRESIRTAGSPAERQQIITDAGFGDVSKADIESMRELSDDELMGAAGAGSFSDSVHSTVGKIGNPGPGFTDAAMTIDSGVNSAVDEVSSWFDW